MPGGDYDGVGNRHIADYDYEVGADADYNTYHMSYIDEMVMILMVIMVMTMLMIMLMIIVMIMVMIMLMVMEIIMMMIKVMIMVMILVVMMTKTFVTRSSPVQGEVAQHCVFI